MVAFRRARRPMGVAAVRMAATNQLGAIHAAGGAPPPPTAALLQRAWPSSRQPVRGSYLCGRRRSACRGYYCAGACLRVRHACGISRRGNGIGDGGELALKSRLQRRTHGTRPPRVITIAIAVVHLWLVLLLVLPSCRWERAVAEGRPPLVKQSVVAHKTMLRGALVSRRDKGAAECHLHGPASYGGARVWVRPCQLEQLVTVDRKQLTEAEGDRGLGVAQVGSRQDHVLARAPAWREDAPTAGGDATLKDQQPIDGQELTRAVQPRLERENDAREKRRLWRRDGRDEREPRRPSGGRLDGDGYGGGGGG